MKKILALIGVFISAIAVLELFMLNKVIIHSEKGVTFELKSGTSKYRVLADLYRDDITNHPIFYTVYILPTNNNKLKSGEYFFPKGSTFKSIWYQVTTGKGQIFHPFIIIPGWTFAQVRESLEKATWARHVINQNWTDEKIMTALGYQNLKPEGEFFPETYFFTKGVTDLSVLKRAFMLMQKKLFSVWNKRNKDLPYATSYEALIAASLVEKEAYLKSEQRIIAGVLVNRLRKNMLLQFDPTVIYGLGKGYTGRIYKEDLRLDTPYNTYVHKGLPPTPIAMPSLSSIEATLNPEQHDYYYFVAKGNGAHYFSKSLAEHNNAVKALMKHQSFFNNDKLNQYLEKKLFVTLKPTEILIDHLKT